MIYYDNVCNEHIGMLIFIIMTLLTNLGRCQFKAFSTALYDTSDMFHDSHK